MEIEYNNNSTNKSEKGIIVVFRNDDLSATSDIDHERKIADIFQRYAVPQTLGVIPFCTAGSFKDPKGNIFVPLAENRDIVDFLISYTQQSGSEIALHGYYHQANYLSRPWKEDFSEFRGLSLNEQINRIKSGKKIISSVLGIIPETFIPPWNRLENNTLQACIRNGIEIVSSGIYIRPIEGIKLFGTNCDIKSFSYLYQKGMEGKDGNRVFLCLNYHSRTLTAEEIRSLEEVVKIVAESREVAALTIREAINYHYEEIKKVNEAGISVVAQNEVWGSDRAKAEIYRRVFFFLNPTKSLNCNYKEARRNYEKGQYDDVISGSPEIEKLSKKLVLLGRFGIGLASCVLWAAIVMLGINLDIKQLALFMLLAVICFFIIGLIGRYYASAPDTKKEIAMGFMLWLPFGGIAILLTQLLMKIKGW